jgi:hypothetical protein
MTQTRVAPSTRAEMVPVQRPVPRPRLYATATRTFYRGIWHGVFAVAGTSPPQTPAVGPFAAARREEVVAMVVAECHGHGMVRGQHIDVG